MGVLPPQATPPNLLMAAIHAVVANKPLEMFTTCEDDGMVDLLQLQVKQICH